jgi:chloramphenicol-sensitive protein RarD
MRERSEETKGFVYGLAAYIGWGFAPIYWPLLQPSTPYEVLAHRVVWSVIFLLILNTLMRTWTPVRTAWANPRSRRLLSGAAVLITINWGLYIWSVNHQHVVDASLGYFITPLLSVAMGVLILGERMRLAQWVAVGIAFSSIVILTVDAGQVPWIGLILASTFGSYGLVKKLAQVEAIASLTIETMVAFPFGLAYLLWLNAHGDLAFGHTSFGHSITVLSAGVITAVPLLGFGAAAVRVPLVTLGLMQYFSPVVQFLVGIIIIGESMTAARWVGFLLLWVGLVVYSVDMVRHSRTPRV